MKYCKNCSASNSFDAFFCNNCGSIEFVSRHGEDLITKEETKSCKLHKKIIVAVCAVIVCVIAVLAIAMHIY